MPKKSKCNLEDLKPGSWIWKWLTPVQLKTGHCVAFLFYFVLLWYLNLRRNIIASRLYEKVTVSFINWTLEGSRTLKEQTFCQTLAATLSSWTLCSEDVHLRQNLLLQIGCLVLLLRLPCDSLSRSLTRTLGRRAEIQVQFLAIRIFFKSSNFCLYLKGHNLESHFSFESRSKDT